MPQLSTPEREYLILFHKTVEKGRQTSSMNTYRTNTMSLYSSDGERLYLNESERQRFIEVATKQTILVKLFCLTLVYTGCRLTEAVKLTKQDIQVAEGIVSIRSLKKRDKHHVREVPVPKDFSQSLATLLDPISDNEKLWHIASITGWRWVKKVMQDAHITGAKATPKGLRHSFGTHAVLNSIFL